MTVENDKGNTQVFEVLKTFTFIRNMYTNMVREIETASDNDNTPYVTFKADTEQTLTMSITVESLEYSVNNGDWKELGTNTIKFGGDYGNLTLRGKSAIGTTGYSNGYSYNSNIQFGNSTLVSCSGDIRTLVDYENYNTTNTVNARFRNLFRNCQVLLTAPELPATNLADYCYEGMFYRCESLKSAPKLPATNLTIGCYEGMFRGCISLTETPKLPATILADYCYQGMFRGCSSLTGTGELPATTLTACCYESMFSDCTSLTEAPELPATTLTANCYGSMFYGCKSLKKAPKLPATILTDYCYCNMFNGCSKLDNITMLATNISAENCLGSWVKDVSSIGTFTKAKEMNTLPSGNYGIPSGWAVFDYKE